MLYVIIGVVGLLVLLLVYAYFFKPELLILPYSKFISIFVNNPPIVDKEKYFPESKELEAHWTTIRSELEGVLKEVSDIPKFHEVDSIQRFISAKDDIPWRVYGIKAFDKWIEPNCSKVPRTAELLRKMPNVSLAMFSILDGGKRIPRHFGFNRGVFRYHLGVLVPDKSAGECYIICGGERYDWQNGEGVLFDDTYWHEVWNNTNQRRVVLFLDVLRDSSLPAWIRPLNKHIYHKLAQSKRLQKAAKKAEVVQDIMATDALVGTRKAET